MANVERIRQWVEALRSGDYEQGQGQLRSRDQYCCFGVLCDISRLDQWQGDDTDGDYRYRGRRGFPDNKVSAWVGITNYDVNEDGQQTDVATLNDNGAPFSHIAALLEEKYL